VKRAIVLLALVGCATERAPAKPAEAPVALAPVRVKTVINRLAKGWLKADSPFVVVLTRPVEPVADALALVDDSVGNIQGTTTWLDRQVVAFYPSGPIARGLDLHLRLVLALRATDGSTLAPSEIATASTPDIEASGSDDYRLGPMGDFTLSIDREIPASDIESLGALTDGGNPVAFSARRVSTLVYITAKTAFRPGAKMVFGWKSGPIAKTSVGRVHLAPFRVDVNAGFSFAVGEREEKCRYVHIGGDDASMACKSDVVHIVFSAPIADSEIAHHIRPALSHATTGDLRGHRVAITLGKKPVAIELDAKLQDVFGQHKSYASKLDVRRED
jgi:hypothetical protein